MPRSLPSYDQATALLATSTRAVPPEHGDANGHMNVRHYLALFDDAEWEMFETVDLGERHAGADGAGIFALEQHLTYRREVAVGDEVAVHVRWIGRTGRFLHLLSFLVDHTRHEVAASMEALECYVDLDTRRLKHLPEPAAHSLDRWIAADDERPWVADLSGAITLQ